MEYQSLEGDFLKNAKSCEEVITSVNYTEDQIGGKTITHKIGPETPDEQPENPNNQPENSDNLPDNKENPNDQKEDSDNKKGNNKTGIIVGVTVALLVIVAIGVICFIVYKRKFAHKDDDDSNNDEEKNNARSEIS
ncbi:regulation of response to stimulus [Trichomonas vaginalis G3]|uniref:regulation of response to stimulus n=1 Tax=Trichomonas vaginalis (strain ATCC PRA-98 / G3) TaxID=412133 RepID=UPI0021E53430|nr:regulation of response to stimulus [Trichomonas vaginalis G3]KAI5544688.1 regulation of response to stimulus [Trichomonas vaginalis G3]